MKLFTVIVLSSLLCSNAIIARPGYNKETFFREASEDSIVAKDAKPVLISNQFNFTEGPAVDSYGNVFFTDQPNDRIWKYGTNGKLSLFMEKAGRSNGLYFDHNGNLISCADEKDELWCIDSNKKVKVLIKDFEGKKLNGPNDLWIRPDDNIYFTDPYYQRPYWTRKEPDIKAQNVYFSNRKTKHLIVVADDLEKPNGIIGTADGKTLYVADIGAGKTYSYDIMSDGQLSNKKLFAEQGSDGMTIDNKGNIYLTGKGVTVYDRSGKQIQHIAIDQPWTANVCFGGTDRNVLFITASTAVYTLQMNVKGVQ